MFRLRPAEEDASQADTASTILFPGAAEDDSSSDEQGLERRGSPDGGGGGSAWERRAPSTMMARQQRGAARQGLGVEFLDDDSGDDADTRVVSWLERQGSASPAPGTPVGTPTTLSSARSPSQHRAIAQVRATANVFVFIRPRRMG